MWITSKPQRQSSHLAQNTQNIHHRNHHSFLNEQDSPVQQIQELVRTILQYQPISEFINSEQLTSSPHLQIKRFKDSVYWGEVSEGKRNGQGIMLYLNKRVYQGNWQNNYRNGKGLQKFSNGSVYKGDYAQGKPDGCGRYQWENGQLYEGEWKAGLKHGSGIWRGAKGDSYIGQWRQGKAEGYGVHTWTNGDRYQGQFQQCLKHGEGVQRFANGDTYKGNYEKGKPNGLGQYYWASGSFFKGNFKCGLRCGQGVWKKGPGLSDKYEGEWLNDKKQGYGIFTWSQGNIYKGNYKSDIRQGYGQMYFTDGQCYKGTWKNDQQLQIVDDQIEHDGDCQLFLPSTNFYPQNPIVINDKHSHKFFQDMNDLTEPMPLYNEPSRPAILKSASRNYRQRNMTKPASRGQIRSRGELKNKSQSQNNRSRSGLTKKMSVGTVTSKVNPYQMNNQRALSSSFFVYKVQEDAASRVKQGQRRQIRTSGGNRNKWISNMEEELKYFTRTKMGSHTQLH